MDCPERDRALDRRNPDHAFINSSLALSFFSMVLLISGPLAMVSVPPHC